MVTSDPKGLCMQLGSIYRLSRSTIAMALAAALLASAGMSARADGIARPPAPGPAPQEIVKAQAAAAAPTPNVEANLSRLHQELHITPAQQPKFDAFANAMRENSRMRPTAAPANPSAVDDLRLAISDTRLQLAALQRLLPAMQALYASLSAPQQKTADQVFRAGPQ
jgi:periplasmic protein CpxP/Spy